MPSFPRFLWSLRPAATLAGLLVLGLVPLSLSIRAESLQPEQCPEPVLGPAPRLAEVPLGESPTGRRPPTALDGVQATAGFTIDSSDRFAVLQGYHRYYRDSAGYTANHGWTGDVANCQAGTVMAEFQEDVLRRINYFRAQAGLPADVVFVESKHAQCQEAALLFSRNNALSHTPPPEWSCYSAAAAAAAGASNISLGSYGAGSIDRLMRDDGSNNSAVGHRRWLLYRRAREMGNGSIPPNSYNAANAVWVIGDFLASAPVDARPWPNAGFVPYDVVPDATATYPRWSFTYPGADFSGATVTMTRAGQPVAVTLEPVQNGYGDNTLVWRPAGVPGTAPAQDTPYAITIAGVQGVSPTTFAYEVTVIDPYDLGLDLTPTGPAQPPVSQPTAYSFPAVPGADGYTWRSSTFSPGDWVEGAEDDPAPQVLDGTSASYALRTSTLAAEGTHSFHLTIPGWSEDGQYFQIDRPAVPAPGSQWRFFHRFRFVTLATSLRAQISSDGGVSWTTLWTRFGDAASASGQSSQWETAWQSAAVDIPAEFHDREVRLRFALFHGNSAFLGTSDSLGCFIDSVRLTNSSELRADPPHDLPPEAVSFAFTPPAADTVYRLETGATLGGHFFGYGPPLTVTARSAYQSWRLTHFPDLGGPLDDDDHDGLPNLLEAALAGADPTRPDASLLPAPQRQGTTVSLTVAKSGLAGLHYRITASADPAAAATWTTEGLTTVEETPSTLTIETTLAPGAARFLRLEVSEDPFAPPDVD